MTGYMAYPFKGILHSNSNEVFTGITITLRYVTKGKEQCRTVYLVCYNLWTERGRLYTSTPTYLTYMPGLCTECFCTVDYETNRDVSG